MCKHASKLILKLWSYNKYESLTTKWLQIWNISIRRRHSFLNQQPQQKIQLVAWVESGIPLSFIQSHWRFLCVHVVNSKFYFWLCLKPDSSVTKAKSLCIRILLGLPVGLQCFTASLNSEAYSCRHCVYCFCVIWIPARSPECKLFEKIEPGIPALLRYQRYFTRIPVVWYSRRKLEDWFLSDKTPLYLYRREKKVQQLAYGIMAMTSLLSAERLCQTWI